MNDLAAPISCFDTLTLKTDASIPTKVETNSPSPGGLGFCANLTNGKSIYSHTTCVVLDPDDSVSLSTTTYESTSDTFYKTKSGLITHVLFSGEKTQYNSRVVRLIDGKLITALTGFYHHRDEQFRYSSSSRAINSTPHSMRALSAQTYRKKRLKNDTKE